MAKNKTTDKLLLENFVRLQKVLADVSVKLTRLLDIFEKAAESFVGKEELEKKLPGVTKGGKEVPLLDKLDLLLEQNKTIAKGLTLLEESMRNRPRTRINPL